MLSSPLWIFQSELVKTEVDCRSIHSYIIMKIHPWYRPLATPDTIHRLSTPDITHPLSTLDTTHPLATPDTTHPLFTLADTTHPLLAWHHSTRIYPWHHQPIVGPWYKLSMTHPWCNLLVIFPWYDSPIICSWYHVLLIDQLYTVYWSTVTSRQNNIHITAILQSSTHSATLPMSNNLQTATVFTLSESKLKVFAVLFAVNLFNSVN